MDHCVLKSIYNVDWYLLCINVLKFIYNVDWGLLWIIVF